jgi:hypothetical protein
MTSAPVAVLDAYVFALGSLTVMRRHQTCPTRHTVVAINSMLGVLGYPTILPTVRDMTPDGLNCCVSVAIGRKFSGVRDDINDTGTALTGLRDVLLAPPKEKKVKP